MFKKLFQKKKFTDSASYWENRYAAGGTSGDGSYGDLARFKAEILNSFVAKHDIHSVIEFGCGDGNQLKLATYPSYIGFDVSDTAVQRCRTLFNGDPTKRFESIRNFNNDKAELTLSLDVIYHLVEDNVFGEYMSRLFASSEKFVIIYSNDFDGDGKTKSHVRFRKFSDWVVKNATGWELLEKIPNRFREASPADFFIYVKQQLMGRVKNESIEYQSTRGD